MIHGCEHGLCGGVPDDPSLVIEKTMPFDPGAFWKDREHTKVDYDTVKGVVERLEGIKASSNWQAPGILSLTIDTPASRSYLSERVLYNKHSPGVIEDFQRMIHEVGLLYTPEMAMERLKGQMLSDHTLLIANGALRSYEAQVVAMGGRTAVDEVKWRIGA